MDSDLLNSICYTSTSSTTYVRQRSVLRPEAYTSQFSPFANQVVIRKFGKSVHLIHQKTINHG